MDVDVGFHIIQDIITVEDDVSLYDNQGAVPNLASPGADRYRIRMILTTKNAVDPQTQNFSTFAKVRGGVIVSLKKTGDNYNVVEKRMAQRQFDTTGDFIVNPFNIAYQAGNDDSSLTMTVEGQFNGLSATAFLDGYRLELPYDSDYSVRKPLTHTSKASAITTIAYKNFVTSPNDGTGLPLWPDDGDITTQIKWKLFNVSTEIGYARLKAVTRSGAALNTVKYHLYDIRMNAGQNFLDVESMSAGSGGSKILLTQNGNNNYVIEPEINTSIFEIPGGRVKSLGDVRFSGQVQFEKSTGAGTGFSMDCGNGKQFTNELEWVFINTTNNTAPYITTIQNNGQDATVTGLDTASDYTVFAYVRDNEAAPKEKRAKRVGYEEWTSADATSDFFPATDYFDGIRLLSARPDSANSKVELRDQVEFDGGQRDNFYSPIKLKRSSIPGSVTTLYVKYDYFEWSDIDGTAPGDFFCVNSYKIGDSAGDYPKFSYSDIPTYVSTRDGASYDMRNQIDFRSKLNPTLEQMSATDKFAIPKDGGLITYDVEWYNRRIDNISLGYNQSTLNPEIRINEGVEALKPSSPSEKANEMVLFSANYGGNTLSPTDVSVLRRNYKRFTMTDIENLEQRVDQLEETVALSFLEQSASNLVVLDNSGAVRSKTGFFVDDFSNGLNLTASPIGPNWVEDVALVGQTLLQVGTSEYSIEPKRAVEAVSLLFDSGGDVVNGYQRGRQEVFDRLSNNGNTNFKRVGDVIYLDYRETLDASLSNKSISWVSGGKNYEEQGYYNVNPFNVFSGEGRLKLSPNSDTWTDTHHLPNINLLNTVVNTKIIPRTTTSFSGEQWIPAQSRRFRWGTRALGSEVTTTTSTEVSVSDRTEIDRTENALKVISVPFARQRPIFCKAQGLRPNTRYWPYFDGIDVSQWTKSLSKSEYSAKIQSNEHLRTYAPVDTNLNNQHPDVPSAIVTGPEGELYYSFWLPNSAPLPSPNGNGLTTFEEWEAWIANQVRLSAELANTVKSPAVYDSIGWKFKSGTVGMKLLDVSGGNDNAALSRASSYYVSAGKVNVKQKSIFSTRTIDIDITNTTNTNTRFFQYDPLAQSFTIDAREGLPGVFVTSVDVYLRKAPNVAAGDAAIPLQMQIREIEAGVPKNAPPNEQFAVYKSAADCFAVVDNIENNEDLDDVLANPVNFEFEEPVYLQAGTEYAIVLLADTDNYEAFVSTTYGLVLGKTEQRISQQPASGSLFLSQNGSTWTPRQDQNLAYQIHTAKFKQEGNVNFANSTYPKFIHNQQLMTVDPGSLDRFRVNHFAHGLGVGDTVSLTGLTPAGVGYLGLTGNQIMDPQLKVHQADAAGYFVKLVDSAAPFLSGGLFGEAVCETNQAFNYDRALFNVETQNFEGTSIDYEGNFISGASLSAAGNSQVTDTRFQLPSSNIPLRDESLILFSSPRMLADNDQELNQIGTTGVKSPSIVIGTTFRSTTSSTFGSGSAQDRVDGYVSDVSPMLDLQRSNFTMESFLVDNQVYSVSDSPTIIQNKPFFFVPETNPQSGSSPSKHITKPIVLKQAAQGIKVFVEMNKPPSASFDLYYRLANGDDDIYEVSWIRASAENNPPDDKFSAETYDVTTLVYTEYDYLIGGTEGTLDDFTSFQLKVVMKTTNTCEVPVMKSIIAIALI